MTASSRVTRSASWHALSQALILFEPKIWVRCPPYSFAATTKFGPRPVSLFQIKCDTCLIAPSHCQQYEAGNRTNACQSRLDHPDPSPQAQLQRWPKRPRQLAAPATGFQ